MYRNRNNEDEHEDVIRVYNIPTDNTQRHVVIIELEQLLVWPNTLRMFINPTIDNATNLIINDSVVQFIQTLQNEGWTIVVYASPEPKTVSERYRYRYEMVFEDLMNRLQTEHHVRDVIRMISWENNFHRNERRELERLLAFPLLPTSFVIHRLGPQDQPEPTRWGLHVYHPYEIVPFVPIQDLLPWAQNIDNNDRWTDDPERLLILMGGAYDPDVYNEVMEWYRTQPDVQFYDPEGRSLVEEDLVTIRDTYRDNNDNSLLITGFANTVEERSLANQLVQDGTFDKMVIIWFTRAIDEYDEGIVLPNEFPPEDVYLINQ